MRSRTVGVLVLLALPATMVWLAIMIGLFVTHRSIETFEQATSFSLSLGLLQG